MKDNPSTFPHDAPGELLDTALGRTMELARRLAGEMGRKLKIMEVCGTHTVAFAHSGLTGLLSEYVDLRSGPGCPVCVTHQDDLDRMIAAASIKDTVIVTFGDLIRVPGSSSTLEMEKARGAHVHICYSPMEALEICSNYPQKEVVLLGTGFETTTPSLALTVLHAQKRQLKNFSIITALKRVPPALDALFARTEHNIDGLILPGHVSAVLGRKAFDYLAPEYGLPAVIAGFEPFDLVAALFSLLTDLARGETRVSNLYKHVVRETGNGKAIQVTESVFENEESTRWRGLGTIPGSGLKLRKTCSNFDAAEKFDLNAVKFTKINGCRCGDVITGALIPFECPLFKKSCTPMSPAGPCMVSQEGACSAYYRYLI